MKGKYCDILQGQMSLTRVVCNVRRNVLLYKERLLYEVRFSLKLKAKNEYLNGIYKEMTELIGMDNAEILFKKYRGQQINFPVEFYSKQYIYSHIVAEYDGTNIKELATKYSYSERTIRRILNENK